MRIIAGQFRGRKLLPPESDATRPVTDRVKQSLFDILTALLPDAVVYDCFAGTGSMGLESLSRGARKAVFFEADRSALVRLRKNIETLGVAKQVSVVAGDLFKWFRQTPAVTDRVDVFFLDPPYRFLREQPETLRELAGLITERHLKPDGTVVFRHDAEDRLDLPALERYDERTYGGMSLEFLRPRKTGDQTNAL
jgi:16S rRNA (guanine966-N2)-methyltransferase